jgi:hypothetical protein
MSGFKLPSNWEENEQYLAQVGHFLGGAIVIVLATLFSIVCGAGWLPILITLGVGIVAAAVKEFVLDRRPPESDSLANSTMDFAFYMIGAAVGLGVTAFAMFLLHRYRAGF